MRNKKAIFEGQGGYTKEQQEIVDIDGDGKITQTDMNTLRTILEATDTETYENIVQTYLENKVNTL